MPASPLRPEGVGSVKGFQLNQPWSVYLDTSVVGAYSDNRDPRRRELTREFWSRIPGFSTHVSSLVLDELAAVGRSTLRDRLIGMVSAFRVLPITQQARDLARNYIEAGVVVETFSNDALHLAIASAHGMDYLVSWNFRHIVNVRTRALVGTVNVNKGFRSLEIVAPPELR